MFSDSQDSMILDLPYRTQLFADRHGMLFKLQVNENYVSAIILETQLWIFGGFFVTKTTYYGIGWIKATKKAQSYFQLKTLSSLHPVDGWRVWGKSPYPTRGFFSAESLMPSHKILLPDGNILFTQPILNLPVSML